MLDASSFVDELGRDSLIECNEEEMKIEELEQIVQRIDTECPEAEDSKLLPVPEPESILED